MQQRFHKLIFEVAARLAQTRALAEHAADAEAMTDERIQRDAPGGNVAASFAWPQGDSQAVAQRLEHLGFDEGQRTARRTTCVRPRAGAGSACRSPGSRSRRSRASRRPPGTRGRLSRD